MRYRVYLTTGASLSVTVDVPDDLAEDDAIEAAYDGSPAGSSWAATRASTHADRPAGAAAARRRRGALERRVWAGDGHVQSVQQRGWGAHPATRAAPLRHGPMQVDARRWELTDAGRDALTVGWYR